MADKVINIGNSDNKVTVNVTDKIVCPTFDGTATKVGHKLSFGNKTFDGSSTVVLSGADLGSVDLTSELTITGLKTFSGETYLDSFTANSGIIKGPLRVINKITGELIGNASTASNVAWSGVTGKPSFATVATTGSYNDLSDKPNLSSLGGLPSTTKYAAGDAIGGSANYLRWETAASSSTARKIPIAYLSDTETTSTRFRAVYYDALTYRTDTNTISANISGNAATATNVKWSGVTGKPTFINSFGTKNGDITIRGDQTKNGSVNLIMSNNELLASIVGLGSNAYTSTAYLPLAGGTMALGEGLKLHADENYFGTNLDARIISLLDGNGTVCDGGLIIDERATLNGVEHVTELLRIRDSEFKWKGNDIYHSGNLSPMTTSHPANSITQTNIDNWNAVHTWYTTATADDTTNTIDTWKEIEAFVSSFTKEDNLATYLANNYLAKSGGTMSGVLTLTSGSTSAYDKTAISFIKKSDKSELARIGTDQYDELGLYAKGAIYIRPNVTFSDSTNGLIISNKSFTYNGTAVSLAGHRHSYLPLNGGTITSNTFAPLIIECSGSTNAAAILFKNSNGTLGYIGMTSSADGGLIRWKSDTSETYTILDSSNSSVSLSGSTLSVKINGTTKSLTNTDTKVTQTVTNSNNTDYRPVILGYSSNDLTNSFSTTTSSVLAAVNVYIKPDNGNLYTKGSLNASTTISSGTSVSAGTTVTAATSITSTAGDFYVGGTSGSRCHIKMDTTNKCIKFIFD